MLLTRERERSLIFPAVLRTTQITALSMFQTLFSQARSFGVTRADLTTDHFGSRTIEAEVGDPEVTGRSRDTPSSISGYP